MQADDSPAVHAQDLKLLRDASRTQAVLWTVRRSYCTLQILENLPARLPARVPAARPQVVPMAGRIRATLVMADGMRVAPTGQWETPAGPVNPRQLGTELLYAFPLEAGREAVAVALVVDGQEHVQRLEKSAR